MPTKVKAALLTTCLVLFALGTARPALGQGNEITILCSNGIRVPMEKLLPQYERSMNIHANVRFGASANFKQAIEGGEAFDLAILTPPLIEDLIKQGKIAAGSETQIASTGIGVAIRAGAPKADVSTAEGLKQLLLKAKSIAYVKRGASTPAIENAFGHLGVGQEVRNKVVDQPGAQQSMASVAAGKSEIAIGLVSEILPAEGVQLAGQFPPEFQTRITMAAGISASAKNRQAAEKIVKALMSKDAAPAIKAAGLDPIAAGK